MKKLFSIILIVVILLSAVTVIDAGATNRAPDKEFLFLDDFNSKHGVYEYPDPVDYYYDEIYYHYVDENDPESEIDWALVYALAYAGSPMGVKSIVADRVLATGHDVWYKHGWAIYDAQTKEFISVDEVDVTKYSGLEKGFSEAKVGNPFGDADHDGELTVLDATHIQRVLAGLCEFDIRDDLSQYSTWSIKYDRPLDYISDYNRDGERSVLDATAIQMKLAKAENTVVE
ncbi:MAG: hypothetical protein IJE16_03780 [Ruminococcus sp.]|nr:hypothetical protein [Ruminococcus sp.]